MQLTECWPLGPAQSLVHSGSLNYAHPYCVSAPAGGMVRAGCRQAASSLELPAFLSMSRAVLLWDCVYKQLTSHCRPGNKGAAEVRENSVRVLPQADGGQWHPEPRARVSLQPLEREIFPKLSQATWYTACPSLSLRTFRRVEREST